MLPWTTTLRETDMSIWKQLSNGCKMHCSYGTLKVDADRASGKNQIQRAGEDSEKCHQRRG